MKSRMCNFFNSIKNNPKRHIILYVLSFFLSLSFILSYNIGERIRTNTYFFDKFKFDFKFFGITLLLSIPIFIIFKIIIVFLSKIEFKGSKNVWSNKKIGIISFISIFITGMIFLITYYPGTCMVDTIQIFYDPIGYSFQYPLLYGLLITSIFNFFKSVFDSLIIGFFCLSFIQLLFMCFVLTYMIRWIHKTFKNNIFTLITILYFNVFTIIANYNITNLRDTIFAAFILLLMPIIYEMLKSKGECFSNDKFVVKTIITTGLLTLIRNNGIFTVLILLGTIIMINRKVFENVLKVVIGVLVISLIPKMLPSDYQREGLFQETVGIPIQQIYLVAMNGDLSDEDLEYLNKVFPTELLSTFYDPYQVDTIKWSLFFDRNYLNETKGEFVKVWIKNMPNNIELYTKSYLANTYYLWAIKKFEPWQSRFLTLDTFDFGTGNYFDGLENKQIWPNNIQNFMTNFYEHTIYYLNSGGCFWLYVLLALIVIFKNQKDKLIYFIPCGAIWLNLMLAAPLSVALRYMCSYIYLLPFLLIIIFVNNDEKILKKRGRRGKYKKKTV